MGIYTVNGDVISITTSDEAYYESIAKEKLNDKIIISLGDSYTYAMKDNYDSLAQKYRMLHDGRGIVSSSISTSTTAPMCTRVDTIASEYASGCTYGGKTYYRDDVAVIAFMGGANDGPGIPNGIGTGIHETDTSLIYGAMNKILSVLQENFTKAIIMCILQPSNYVFTQERIDEWVVSDEVAQRLGFDSLAEAQVMSPVQISNYCMGNKEKAVETAAWHYEVPILDMFHGFPSVLNPSNRSKYWQNDRLHLTSDGYGFLINEIEKCMVRLVAESYEG